MIREPESRGFCGGENNELTAFMVDVIRVKMRQYLVILSEKHGIITKLKPR